MPNYKVLVEFELEGVVQKVDDQIVLEEEAAKLLVDEGKLEAIAE